MVSLRITSVEVTPNFTFKICILGDDSKLILKLLNPFLHLKFNQAYLLTVGLEPVTRYQKIEENTICFSLWIIASQDRFDVMRGMFYQGSHASLIFVDLTRGSSLDNAIKLTNQSLAEKSDQLVSVIGLRGAEDELELTMEDLELKFGEFDIIHFYETSVEHGENIVEMFTTLGLQLVGRRKGGEITIPKSSQKLYLETATVSSTPSQKSVNLEKNKEKLKKTEEEDEMDPELKEYLEQMKKFHGNP